MFRTALILIQVLLVAAAALWIYNRPGSVDIHWLGYDIHANPVVAFFAVVIVVAVLLAFYKITGFFLSIPRRWHQRYLKKSRDKGYKALTLGLSAVAAGDAKLASYQAYRMRQAMPDEKGLPWLLEAQAARLRGDEIEAQGFFEKLLKDKETSFLGVRGLLQSAVENSDLDRALVLARQALAMHSDQPWIIRTVFGLETQKREWAAALATLKKGERGNVWSTAEIQSSRIALLLQQADELTRAGYVYEAVRKLREAQHINPSFVPTAVRLAKHYIVDNKRRSAVAVLERAWKDNPHPDLAVMWDALAPSNKPSDVTAHLRWFERLVAIKPGDAESQMAAARAAIEDGMWGEAWQYLAEAEKIRPNARLYRMWAQMEEMTHHNESAKRYWEKASTAPADKVWTCTETGRIYEHWSAIAEPHGSFNTIVWDHPRVGGQMSAQLHGPAAADLIIEPVRQLSVRH